MLVEFASEYKSIREFQPIELPSFTVLTGPNGSGKSHLLEAIRDRKVVVDSRSLEDIVLFDLKTFNLDDESRQGLADLNASADQAYSLFQQQVRSNIQSLKRDYLDGGGLVEALLDRCRTQECSLWNVKFEVSTEPEFVSRFQNYKTQVVKLFRESNALKTSPVGRAILLLILRLSYLVDEISEDDFRANFRPYYFKQDFLPSRLGATIWDYFVRWKENGYNRIQAAEGIEGLGALSEEEFLRRYGPKPWEVIDAVLQRFGSFSYRVNAPVAKSIFRDAYQLRLERVDDGLKVNFSDLSSGEKILMALVASIYKATADASFPKLLLLDEIDASLHPSMIENLLDVIQSVFLAHGSNVILVTHSPTTVALAPAESIHVMNRTGPNRIEHKEKAAALEILTEGFVTLDKGIKILDQLARRDLIIFTEGHNRKYLERAIQILSPELSPRVEFALGIDDRSGKQQLQKYFELFSRLGPEEKQFMFVWDPDANYRTLQPLGKVIPFVLDVYPEHTELQSGIETLFPDVCFNQECWGEEVTRGTTRKKEFNKSYFLARMMSDDSASSYRGFAPFIAKVREVLSASAPPGSATNKI